MYQLHGITILPLVVTGLNNGCDSVGADFAAPEASCDGKGAPITFLILVIRSTSLNEFLEKAGGFF
jgi:hypothetical protein